jgi:superfamily II DNA or RNA helicase
MQQVSRSSVFTDAAKAAVTVAGPMGMGAKLANLTGPLISKDYQQVPETATDTWDKAWGGLMDRFAGSDVAQAGVKTASKITGLPIENAVRTVAGAGRSVMKMSDFLQSPVGGLTVAGAAAFPAVGLAAIGMGAWNTINEGMAALDNPTPEKVGEVITDALLLYGAKKGITKTRVAPTEPGGQPGMIGKISKNVLDGLIRRISQRFSGTDPRSVQMRASLDAIAAETESRGVQPGTASKGTGTVTPPTGGGPTPSTPTTENPLAPRGDIRTATGEQISAAWDAARAKSPNAPSGAKTLAQATPADIDAAWNDGGNPTPRPSAPPRPAGNVETQNIVGPDGRVQQVQVQTLAEGPPPGKGNTLETITESPNTSLLDQIAEGGGALRSSPPPGAVSAGTKAPSAVTKLSSPALISLLQVEQDRNKRNVLLDEATRRGLHPPDYRGLTDDALRAQWGVESNPQKLQNLNIEAQARGLDLGAPPQRPMEQGEAATDQAANAGAFGYQANRAFEQSRQKAPGASVPATGEDDLDQRARAIADGYKVDYDTLDDGDKQALRDLASQGLGSVTPPAPAAPRQVGVQLSNVLPKTSPPPKTPPPTAAPPVKEPLTTPPVSPAAAQEQPSVPESPTPQVPAEVAGQTPLPSVGGNQGAPPAAAPLAEPASGVITDNGNPPPKIEGAPWSNPEHDSRYIEESARNAMYVQPGVPGVAPPPSGDQLKFPTSFIEADPDRFQYKIGAVGKGGTTDEMRDIQNWDPTKAGTILVWKNPEDGKVYVTNGHHRLERAKALGVPWMDVRFTNDQAPDAASARAVGAMANIAEGRGTSVDAAKVFRDGKLTPEALAKENVPIRGKIAQQGMALAQLAPAIFSQVVNGDLTPERGALIGEMLPDHEQQLAALKVLDMGERKGKLLSDKELRDMIARVQRGPQKLETSADRAQGEMWDFGDVMRSYAFEAAQLSSYVRERIGKEKRLFGTVGANAGALGKAGNKIDVAKSEQIAEDAKVAKAMYDKLYDKDAQIEAAINEGARQVAEKEASYNDVADNLYNWVRDRLEGILNPNRKGTESGKVAQVAFGKQPGAEQPVRPTGQAEPESKVEPAPAPKPTPPKKAKPAPAPAKKAEPPTKSTPPPAEPAKKLSDMSMEEAFDAYQQAKKKVGSGPPQQRAAQSDQPAIQFSEAPPNAMSAEYREFLDWYETMISAEFANGDISPDSSKAEKFYKIFPTIGEKYAPKKANAPKGSNQPAAAGTVDVGSKPNAGANAVGGPEPGEPGLESPGSDGVPLLNKTIVSVGNPPDVDTSSVPKPRTATLAPHQAKAIAASIRAMDKIGGFLNSSGAGSGKSTNAAAVARHYLDAGKSVFLVAPAEVMKFKNQTTGMPSSSYKFWFDEYGLAPDRYIAQQTFEPGKMYVSTYDKFSEAPVNAGTVLIFDESHALRNLGDSQRSEYGANLIDRAGHVLFMSATPADKPYQIGYLKKMGLLEDKSEAQAIADLGMELQQKVNKKTGKTFQKWEVREGVDPRTIRKRFVDLFTRMIENGNMRKDEILLDGLDIQAMNIHLPEEGHEVQRFLTKEMNSPNTAVRLMHLRRQQEPFKIDATIDLVKHELRQGRKVVVFAARVNASDVINRHRDPYSGDVIEDVIYSSEGTLKTLKRRFQEEGITRIAELHGAAEEKGAAAMDRFQAGGADVIIATSKSGGTGIDLDDTKGDAPRSVVVMTPDFDALSNVQLMGRIYRMSTKSNGRVFYLFADTPVDRWNAGIFSEKMKTLASVVQGESKKMDVAQFFGNAADDELREYLKGSAPKEAKARPLRGARYGDYIEFFGDDAHTVADATGLPIHKARNGKEIAGFPVKDLSLYQKQLNDKGISFNYIDRSADNMWHRRPAVNTDRGYKFPEQPLLQRSAPTPSADQGDLFDKALREVDLSPEARRAARGAVRYQPQVLERWTDRAGKEIEIRKLDEHSFWKYLTNQDPGVETYADFQAKYPSAKYYSVYRNPKGYVFNLSAVSRSMNNLRPRGGEKVEKFTSPMPDAHLDIASHFIEQSQPPHGYAKHTPEEWQRRRVANEPASGMPPMWQKSDVQMSNVLPKTSPPPGSVETLNMFPDGEAERLEQEHTLDRAILEAQRLSAEFGSPLTRTNLRKALKKAKLPEQGDIFAGPLEEDEGNGLLFSKPFSDVPYDRTKGPDAMIESARMRYYPPRSGRPGRVYINQAGVQILRGVFSRIGWDSGGMDGIQLEPRSVAQINGVLRHTKSRATMSEGAVQVLDQLADMLDTAVRDNGEFAVIRAGDGRTIAEIKATVSHEMSHVVQQWFRTEDPEGVYFTLAASRSLPNYQKAERQLIDQWRYPDKKIELFQEILSHTLAGQHGRLDLTEEESTALLFAIRRNALEYIEGNADELFKYGRPGIRKAISGGFVPRTSLPPGASRYAGQGSVGERP